jgi:hypothetical protein
MPLIRRIRLSIGSTGRSVGLNPCYLEGYNTITYTNEVPDCQPAPSYGLDMPAPRGLSGAPVVKQGSERQVAGVVCGTKETGTVEEFLWVDEAKGRVHPRVA